MNSTIYYEAEGIIFLGSMEFGKIKLGDAGFEFEFKDTRRGKSPFFAWSSIRQAEASVSLRGKIGKNFSLILLDQAKTRFSSKESGTILKHISEQIGREKVVRTASLLDPFTRSLRK